VPLHLKLKDHHLLLETASQHLFANINCQSPHGFSAAVAQFKFIKVISENENHWNE